MCTGGPPCAHLGMLSFCLHWCRKPPLCVKLGPFRFRVTEVKQWRGLMSALSTTFSHFLIVNNSHSLSLSLSPVQEETWRREHP